MDMTKNINTFIKRKRTRIVRDTSRVITRTHIPGNMLRISKIIERVINLSEKRAESLLKKIDRHKKN